MKQRIVILLLIVGLVGVLVALNALTYVQNNDTTDSELRPNRSTYNPGATGTLAFYTLLAETGRKPIRWQQAPDALLSAKNCPTVFVMIGALRRDVTEAEAANLLRWVSLGGRLVLIDRGPPTALVTSTANWKIVVSSDPAVELLSVDPADQNQMTAKTDAAIPAQPTVYTAQVNSVQPSRFAAWVSFERMAQPRTGWTGNASGPPPAKAPLMETNKPIAISTATPVQLEEIEIDEPGEIAFNAPVVHLVGNQKNVLVDVPFGSGKIVYLTDPYIVSNGGISNVDNSQLALNLVATNNGLIAFDEYHQGYGSSGNRLFEYFAGTPVIAIFLQCALLVGLVLLSQSRRFARALPGKEPDRLTKLEYVTAMAELQQRTRAYDLAVENIYSDFRRRACRSLGIDNLTATRKEIAERIAERTSFSVASVNSLMSQCEAIVHGEPTSKGDVRALIDQLRRLESDLGLKRNPHGNGRR
jgi:hypothetical protein